MSKEKINIRFDSEESPEYNQGDEFAQLSQDSLSASTPLNGTCDRLPLPTDWFGRAPQELILILGPLSKAALLEKLVALLSQSGLPGKADNDRGVELSATPHADAPSASRIDLGPEYNTCQLAELCKVSRQSMNQRIRKLTKNGWLEKRYTRRWSFDDAEASIIQLNPRRRKPREK